MTNSINLFPVEEKQTLKTEKLKVNFRFNSYNSYLEIKNNSKELQIYFDNKIIQDQISQNIKDLSVNSGNFIDKDKHSIDNNLGNNLISSKSIHLNEENQEGFDLQTYKKFLSFLKFQEMMDKYNTY